jgi:hypothetical protein
MKKITLALLLLFTVSMVAQQGINYKALIKDGAGVIVASTPINVTFIILDGAANVYEETHAPTTDPNGIVILNIGEGTPVTGTFSTIDWSSNNHFLNVQIDTGGGMQDMATTAFKTVPYALQSKTATTLPGGIDQGYIEALQAQIAALAPQPASIGDLRAGGVVFWVDSTGLHGLVCAFSDYATEVEWGCPDTDLPNVPNVPDNEYLTGIPVGSGAEIGDGFNNTNDILNDCLTAPVALAARSLGAEWFLPSAKELYQMYINKTTLDNVAGFTALGIFYWSSTEESMYNAWGLNFYNGDQFNENKNFETGVRAVRAF